MSSILGIFGALFALIGGIVLFVALFTPKRFVAKRPARFFIGFGMLALAVAMYYFGSRV
jgi:cell division protein FtsW (lipid II flippase)